MEVTSNATEKKPEEEKQPSVKSPLLSTPNKPPTHKPPASGDFNNSQIVNREDPSKLLTYVKQEELPLKIDDRIKKFLDERDERDQKDKEARDVEMKGINDEINKLQE